MVLYLKLVVQLSTMQVLAFLPGTARALLFCGEIAQRRILAQGPMRNFQWQLVCGPSISLEAKCSDFSNCRANLWPPPAKFPWEQAS